MRDKAGLKALVDACHAQGVAVMHLPDQEQLIMLSRPTETSMLPSTIARHLRSQRARCDPVAPFRPVGRGPMKTDYGASRSFPCVPAMVSFLNS